MSSEEEEHFDDIPQFIERVHDIVSRPCKDHEEIDDNLRLFINAAKSFHRDHPDVVQDYAQDGCLQLLQGELFTSNRDYVRRQFIYSLIEEDDYPVLQVMATFLIFDGKSDEETFVMMRKEGLFPRLAELIKSGKYDDTQVHRLLLELLAEMTRIQILSRDDLLMVDDAFILYLFQLIERQSQDVSDPYHFSIVRLILILNEQYMCYTTDDAALPSHTQDPLPNRIIKVLSTYGPAYRSFGESLILILNRQSDLGPQLLILKILYLLFSTPQTFEYFYTNDLHVLVDVIMRNLVDLDPGLEDEHSPSYDPEGAGNRALRHTYLRVLYPLLKNTQLAREDSNYKQEELRRFLRLLASTQSQHFAPVDSTVIRLVSRCRQIDWIKDELEEILELDSPAAKSPPSDSAVAKKLLGMSNIEAGISNLSILDVTAKVEKEEKRERPAIPPPRRRMKKTVDLSPTSPANGNGRLKVKPDIPAPRRARSEQVRDRSPFSDDSPG